MKEFRLEFGALAKPMAEQLPMLSKDKADAFDADNMAIARLSARGLLTKREHLAIHRRFAASIGDAISEIVPQ